MNPKTMTVSWSSSAMTALGEDEANARREEHDADDPRSAPASLAEASLAPVRRSRVVRPDDGLGSSLQVRAPLQPPVREDATRTLSASGSATVPSDQSYQPIH